MSEERRYYRESKGVTILVLGILSLVLCGCFTGIPAWIMGSSEMEAIARGEVDQSNRGFAQAGMIMGIISTILGLCGGVLILMTGGLR